MNMNGKSHKRHPKSKSHTSLNFPTAPNSSNNERPCTSGTRSKLVRPLSQVKVGDTRIDSGHAIASSNNNPSSSSSCCNEFIDDSNRSMLQFVTSSAMLDFLFENNNLCNKSEEQLRKEREAAGPWGYIADKAVEAVGSAMSTAIDLICGESDNSNCDDEDEMLTDDQEHCDSFGDEEEEICPSDDDGGGPQSSNNMNEVKNKTRSNFATVRMVHENAEPVSIPSSQANLLQDIDHPLTYEECLARLDKISELCKMLPNNPFLGECYKIIQNDIAAQTEPRQLSRLQMQTNEDNQFVDQSEDDISRIPLQHNSTYGIGENRSLSNKVEARPLSRMQTNQENQFVDQSDNDINRIPLQHNPNYAIGESRSLSNIGTSAVPSSSDAVVNTDTPSNTLIQGLLKPYSHTTLALADPLTGDLETGILPELVQSNSINVSQRPLQPNINALPSETLSQQPYQVSKSNDPLTGDLETGILPELAQSNSIHVSQRPLQSNPNTLPSETLSQQPSQQPYQVSSNVTPSEPAVNSSQTNDQPTTYRSSVTFQIGSDANLLGDVVSNEVLVANNSTQTSEIDIEPTTQQLNNMTSSENPNNLNDHGGGSKRHPNADFYTHEIVINYMEEEIPYKLYLAKQLLESKISKSTAVEQNDENLKYVLTEVNHGGNIETILEINGQIINDPNNMQSKELLLSELQKMNANGSTLKLKRDVEDVNAIMKNSIGNTDRFKSLNNSSLDDDVTSIRIMEEVISDTGNGGETKTLKEMECTLHDVHTSENQHSTAVEINGKYIYPQEQSTPALLAYFEKLEETEVELEAIANRVQELIKNSTSSTSKNM